MRYLSPSISLCNLYSWLHLSVAACQSDTAWHTQVQQQPPSHKAEGHVPLLPCQLLRHVVSFLPIFFPFILIPTPDSLGGMASI